MKTFIYSAVLFSLALTGIAENKVAPTFKDVKYGPHERNNLNFWQVKSDKPLGVLVHIHGGGWIGGEKAATQNKDVFKKRYQY